MTNDKAPASCIALLHPQTPLAVLLSVRPPGYPWEGVDRRGIQVLKTVLRTGGRSGFVKAMAYDKGGNPISITFCTTPLNDERRTVNSQR